MTVYKNYFKIVYRHLVHIGIYSALFFVIILGFANSSQANTTSYKSVDVKIYLDNKSQSPLARALEDYLSQKFDRKEGLTNFDDDLFYGFIQAYVEIPDDFEERGKVIIKNAPKSMYGMLVERSINDYINKYRTYLDAGFKPDRAMDLTSKDLVIEADLAISDKIKREDTKNSNYYFNFINYVLMAQIILVVSNVMAANNKETIAKRNRVSAYKASRQTLELTLGHFTTALVFLAIYVGFFMIKWPESLGLEASKLMVLNSLVFTLAIVTLAMFMSSLIQNENVLNVVMNIFVLGSSFLSGAFIPQELLSPTSLNISKVLPSYYYITNNNILVEDPSLAAISANLLVLVGFTLAFSIMTVIKVKRKKY
ncbi:MAG: ABC transporter permease [Tissierellia bacterium]|nr:ABC transporter permease [Tissierellia bacterium]